MPSCAHVLENNSLVPRDAPGALSRADRLRRRASGDHTEGRQTYVNVTVSNIPLARGEAPGDGAQPPPEYRHESPTRFPVRSRARVLQRSILSAAPDENSLVLSRGTDPDERGAITDGSVAIGSTSEADRATLAQSETRYRALSEARRYYLGHSRRPMRESTPAGAVHARHPRNILGAAGRPPFIP